LLEPVARKRAWPVLRGRGRGNAPSLPDETWFGIITRQSIRRGTFTSVKVLITQIRDYVTHWNAHAKPFTWTATADEILAKVQLVQTNTRGVRPPHLSTSAGSPLALTDEPHLGTVTRPSGCVCSASSTA
jgi:hypothetical protein